ncbi:hypothetical protein JOC37_001469 [Desulfohalotomaculum tongense]|uniref:DUF1850 domain-containing protein n=1 Tax=Desulforadius tongensis TaxID=1216062 RepID=UPI0019579E93|nr:DUF1850 domain-containing protein [Desulforadius tongensis]MBM7855086.1 hypothetical protein [Desulforadius tongensis]
MTSGGFNRFCFLKITVLLLLVVVPAAWLAVPPAVLIVQEHQTGKVLFRKGMAIDECFTLRYIHSITKQPVQEVYCVKDSHTLALKEMYYDSFGSNLPVGPEQLANEKTTFSVEDGCYKITYQNRTFDRVPLRVGQVVADHTLLFGDDTSLRFADVTKGGTYVDFYVKPFFDVF